MKRLLRLSLTLAVAGLFLGLLGGGTALLHLRAAQSEAAAARDLTPIPVASLVLEAAQSYEVRERYVGRLEPAQQARLAFERAGLITAVAVEEGQGVVRGAVIARLDTALLEAERARLVGERARVAANLELARLTTRRQQVLQSRGHASEQRLDEARLAAAAREGELAALDAAVRRVDIDIEKSVVRAPFAGIVGARFVDTGAVVGAGTEVIELLESDRPQVRIGLSPAAAAGLRAGDPARLVAGERALVGRVAAVRPDLSSATRTVSVLFDLAAVPGLRFGDTVSLELTRRIAAAGFWLPLSALTEGERGLWTVLTLRGDGTEDLVVGQEAVELLHSDGARVFVRGTLRPGQRVVANGRNRVIPGQRVALAVVDAAESEAAR